MNILSPRCVTFGLICFLFGAALVQAEDAIASSVPVKQRPAPHKLILSNDGGTLAAPDMEAPIGVEGFIRETIEPLRDTMVDTLYWQIGTDPYFGTPTHRLTEWFSHRTKVGTQWGEGFKQFNTAGEWRIYENTRQMLEQGTDPVAVAIDAGHKAGIDVFVSLRFNDQHDSKLPGGVKDPLMYPLKREHPDWLTGEPGYGNTYQFNFAVPEVREYRLALVQETIANYDLDGLDLDFCRWPKLFRAGEEQAGMPYITEIIRKVREMLDAKARTAARKLYFSVRVPFSLEGTRAAGLDVPTWIKEKLVDIVVISDIGGWNYRLPVEQFRELAKGTDCKIIAQNLCAFKEPQPRSAKVLFGERDYYSTEQFRAVAARHWQAGADGLFIWNQHFIKFANDDQFDRQSWKEIGNAATLKHLDKHYLVGPPGRGGNLPIELKLAQTADVQLEIADDVAEAKQSGKLKSAIVRVLIEQLTGPDEIAFTLNGVALDRSKATQRFNYNDCWLDFDAAEWLKPGNNKLEITLQKRNPLVASPLKVNSVEAIIRYHQ